MRCRQCGTEIAEKALVCYRCGAATTEAKFTPAQIRKPRQAGRLVVAAIALLAVILIAVWFLISS